MQSLNLEHSWNSLNIDPVVTLEQCKLKYRHIQKTEWFDKVNSMPKLIITHRFLKNEFGTEAYLKLDLSIPLGSYLANTRMGTLALKIETVVTLEPLWKIVCVAVAQRWKLKNTFSCGVSII